MNENGLEAGIEQDHSSVSGEDAAVRSTGGVEPGLGQHLSITHITNSSV